MKFTRLARKKLNLIFHGEREVLESDFLKCFIISAFPPLTWNHGLSCDEVREYCRRCDIFGVEILGLELHTDSPYPLYSFTQEYYTQCSYDSKWIETPLTELATFGIDSFIIPVAHVPDDVLDKYLAE